MSQVMSLVMFVSCCYTCSYNVFVKFVSHIVVCVSVKPVYGIPSSCLGSSVGTVKPETGEIHLAWVGRSIAGPRLRMVEFCAFLEQQLHPDTDSVLNSSISASRFA